MFGPAPVVKRVCSLPATILHGTVARMANPDPPPPPPTAETREARLAARLRENLHRRKAQARAQSADAPPPREQT